MKDNTHHPKASGCGAGIKRVVSEAVLVALAGAGIALAANAVSPLGLALTRNYFPAGTNGITSTVIRAPLPPPGTPALRVPTDRPLADQLKARGLQSIDREQAWRLFRDPRFRQETVLFIDARDKEHYQQGHVPGAYEFDPYRPEKYFATVLPVCQTAEQIVVYCGGGDCEDSQFAAVALRDAGIATPKVFVYTGGFSEWTTNGLPVEIGERNSGNLSNAGK